MEVKPTQPQITTIKVDVAELKAALSNWKVGESLLAVARESSQQGRVMLQIGNLAVEAKSDQPIRAGQQLQLVVERLTPSPVMRVVDNIQPPSPQSIALKNLLPLQRPISELLANLTQLTQTKVVTQLLTAASTAITPSKVNSSSTPLLTPTLPGQPVTTSATTPPPGISRDEVRAITQLAQRLVSQISSSSDISKPGALEQAIKTSGESLFLRKFVLGIQAQANSKNFTRPFMPAAPRRPAYVA
ncbi:hypothetical protein [Candidatus Reidiella endopervernicosa]|uniref:Flagellar hook-length control protein FliK n=1 Tax=Candidatus Reidiella endopervernicosa TaxID=2738883 RepID=A0A6N0HYN2_9GAMM|nr:hypothetical protein [Candidatus Reidiella endopervernicosa]QKQ27286.1 hypothetical protein HUE57_14085 [Candidatus Reidiella endopervernicosa]